MLFRCLVEMKRLYKASMAIFGKKYLSLETNFFTLVTNRFH